jgi:hypothetical protein
VERLEQEKIRLTILIRKLDARLKSLVTQVCIKCPLRSDDRGHVTCTQDAVRIVPLPDLQDYMKFCQSGPSSLPKNSKVAQIARELQKSPVGSPLRGRSPSPAASGMWRPPSVSELPVDKSNLDDSLAEQRLLVLRNIITGFTFARDVEVGSCSPERLFLASNPNSNNTKIENTRTNALTATTKHENNHQRPLAHASTPPPSNSN